MSVCKVHMCIMQGVVQPVCEVDMCIMQVGISFLYINMYAHPCGGQMITLGVILPQVLPPYFLR